MPLLDHFHPPLSARRHWQGFHSAWAGTIAHQLNQELLPPRYFAEPNVQLAGQVRIAADVATFHEAGPAIGGGSVSTAVWTAPPATLRVPLDLADLEVFEVQVLNDEEGPRLIAAVELASPANKDRASHRQAFATKCATYLNQGIAVVIVDTVTSRQANLHNEVLEILNASAATQRGSPANLYAVAYRTVVRDQQMQLEGWAETLSLGAELPTLPLWLEPELAVPLELEQSYVSTCDSLRIT